MSCFLSAYSYLVFVWLSNDALAGCMKQKGVGSCFTFQSQYLDAAHQVLATVVSSGTFFGMHAFVTIDIKPPPICRSPYRRSSQTTEALASVFQEDEIAGFQEEVCGYPDVHLMTGLCRVRQFTLYSWCGEGPRHDCYSSITVAAFSRGCVRLAGAATRAGLWNFQDQEGKKHEKAGAHALWSLLLQVRLLILTSMLLHVKMNAAHRLLCMDQDTRGAHATVGR